MKSQVRINIKVIISDCRGIEKYIEKYMEKYMEKYSPGAANFKLFGFGTFHIRGKLCWFVGCQFLLKKTVLELPFLQLK